MNGIELRISLRMVLVVIAICMLFSRASGRSGIDYPEIIDIRPQMIDPMERELLEAFPWNAEERKGTGLAKVAAPVVGTGRTFWAQNLRDNLFYQVEATCRVVGTHCYIFVDNSQWNTRVRQEDVEAMRRAFDDATPDHPDQGIYEIVTDAFSAPPDVDGDSKVYFLILDIQDDYSGSGAYIAGYFSGVNEFKDTETRTRGYRSNETEMFYVDCNPASVRSESTHGVIAHEFQHMIHFGADSEEETWINEGCSTFTEFLTGYGVRMPFNFAGQTDDSLVDWGSNGLDYEQTGMFVTYLYERFGGLQTIAALVADTTNGTASVSNTLQIYGVNFDDVFRDWVIANYLDDTSLYDGRYGYENYDLSGPYQFQDTDAHEMYPLCTTSATVEYTAADYIRFGGTKDIDVYFSGDDRNVFVLQYIKFQGDLPVEVGEIPLDRNEGYVSFTYGEGPYDSVVIVPIILQSTHLPVSYRYYCYEAPSDVTSNHGISGVVPPPDATDASLYTALRITFNRPYDPDTVHLETGDYPAGQPVRSEDGRTLTVQSLYQLESAKTYLITVQAGVQDVSGNLMVDEDYTWRFTTASKEQMMELVYDTEDYRWRLYWEQEGEGSGVRFTPPYTPAKLSAAHFYLQNIDYGGRFYVRILTDDGSGMPDEDLLAPSLLVTADHTGWLRVDLEPYDIEVNDDFHVMFQYDASSWPSFGAENAPPISGRSWDNEYRPRFGYTFRKILNFDYAIRSVIRPVALEVAEDTEAAVRPERYALDQNSPNPFNSRTQIRYALPKETHLSIRIYNVLGQEIRTLCHNVHTPGFYTTHWDGKDEEGVEVSSGLYVYRIKTAEYEKTRRMVLLR